MGAWVNNQDIANPYSDLPEYWVQTLHIRNHKLSVKLNYKTAFFPVCAYDALGRYNTPC